MAPSCLGSEFIKSDAPPAGANSNSWGKTAGRPGEQCNTFVNAQDETLRGRLCPQQQAWSQFNRLDQLTELGISRQKQFTVVTGSKWDSLLWSWIPYEMPQTCNECMEQNQPYTVSVTFSTERKTDGLALLHVGRQLSNYEPTSWIDWQTLKMTLKMEQILITHRP